MTERAKEVKVLIENGDTFLIICDLNDEIELTTVVLKPTNKNIKVIGGYVCFNNIAIGLDSISSVRVYKELVQNEEQI